MPILGRTPAGIGQQNDFNSFNKKPQAFHESGGRQKANCRRRGKEWGGCQNIVTGFIRKRGRCAFAASEFAANLPPNIRTARRNSTRFVWRSESGVPPHWHETHVLIHCGNLPSTLSTDRLPEVDVAGEIKAQFKGYPLANTIAK
jgi:hypothetical protein